MIYVQNTHDDLIKFELIKYIEDLSIKTKENIIGYHFNRTFNHIGEVTRLYKKLSEILIKEELFFKEIDISAHDEDKTRNYNQVLPYSLINWKYKCKKEDIDFVIPEKFVDICHEATVSHVQFGKHHPEYWDSDQENLISKNDRDGVSRQIDGTYMPLEYIAEMACDIVAVAKERGNTPDSWLDLNVGKRWKFNPNQSYYLYLCVDLLINNKC